MSLALPDLVGLLEAVFDEAALEEIEGLFAEILGGGFL
jgi:hypothetical protein